MSAQCGQCSAYTMQQLAEEFKKTVRCEQCLISIISDTRPGVWKFFVDHVPMDVKRKRRMAWRKYREALHEFRALVD